MAAYMIEHIYRSGYPRVTESLSKHFMHRDTGHQGTGIYGYGSKERALQNEDQPVFEIDVIGIMFFMPKLGSNGWAGGHFILKSLSESMNDLALAKFFGDNSWFGQSIREIELSTEAAREFFSFSMREIDVAVNTSVIEAKNAGLKRASQPINHLLFNRGYGGVDPGEGLRDDNSVGIVIFRETFDIDAGEEEYVDIGTMIRDKRECKIKKEFF